MSIPYDEAPPSSSAVPAGEAHSFARAADGTRLFVRSKGGSHPPASTRAIFCDGILCDGFVWKYLWDSVAPVAPLTHWHYRGHGRSALPVDAERIDIAAHADDLRVVRQHVGDPPCVLFGHSMGCQVALEGYRRNPAGVRGIVLMCGSFGKVTATFHGTPILDLILPRLIDGALKAPDVVRAVWSRIPPEMALKMALRLKEIDPSRINPEDMLPYLHHMTHVDFPMFLRMLRSAGEHSAEDMLARIDVPVLIVAGEKDTFTPAHLAQKMAEAIPHAELLMVKNGSHVAPIEQPELVHAAIDTFLRKRVLA